MEELQIKIDASRQRVENYMKKKIETLDYQGILKDACSYAICSGGKRIRPVITQLVGYALGKGHSTLPAASTVELFHTASLVADDLPCMDDDDERRARPSVHRVYGESVALLVSYTFIAEGYRGIYVNGEWIKANWLDPGKFTEVLSQALEICTRNTGIMGATGGQFYDICPPDDSPGTIQRVMRMKTGSLFEVAFCLGWLFGGGDVDKLDLVKKVAGHFGMAFQISDDLSDMHQDKSKNRRVNLANFLGQEEALKRFDHEIVLYNSSLNALSVDASDLIGLGTLLKESTDKKVLAC